eukprot:931997-Rhodomonas_salina.2
MSGTELGYAATRGFCVCEATHAGPGLNSALFSLRQHVICAAGTDVLYGGTQTARLRMGF